jgi:uncharacterized protein YigA (DUF484 family)
MSDYSLSDEDWVDMDEYEEEAAQNEQLHGHKRTSSYTIIHQHQLENNINSLVAEYAELFRISQDEAYILLAHVSWKPNKLQDTWLDNELKVRIEAGISVPIEGFNFEQSRGMKLGSI